MEGLTAFKKKIIKINTSETFIQFGWSVRPSDQLALFVNLGVLELSNRYQTINISILNMTFLAFWFINLGM